MSMINRVGWAMCAFALLLSVTPVFAQGSNPPLTNNKNKHFTEWVINQETGIPEIVYVVQHSEQAVIERNKNPRTSSNSVTPLSDNYSIGSVILTLTRQLNVTPYYDAGWGLTAYKVKAGAQTQASQCIDSLYVKPKHKYKGPNDSTYYWINGMGHYDIDFCKNDTWMNFTTENAFYPNTTHVAVADHRATVFGNAYSWDNQEGPSGTY